MFKIVLAMLAMLSAGLAQEMPAAPDVEMAYVRAVHLSPNAPEVAIELRSEMDDTVITEEGLSYRDSTDFISLTPGSYTVSVLADGEMVLEEQLSFGGNAYHTVSVIGLVLPDEALEDEPEGFFEWLTGLFADDGQDALALRLEVHTDELFVALEPGERRIRALHAAPGTAPIDLAVQGERGAIIGNLAFGQLSGYHTLDDEVGALEVRVAGSRAQLLDLADVELAAGQIHTLFIVGTPLEDVPLELVVLSDMPEVLEPIDPAAAPAPAAPAPLEEADGGDNDR